MSLLGDKIVEGVNDLTALNTFVRGTKEQTVMTEGGPIPTLASLVENITSKVASIIKATSTSAVTVSIGEHTFDVEPGKSFTPNEWVTISGQAAYMSGPVVSYIDSTLVVNVIRAIGTGTHSPWTISLSGIPGVAGADGVVDSGEEVLISKFPWED